MLKIEKVLYPTDFSPVAERALPWALAMAEKQGAELHLLHALVLHAADEAELEKRYEELTEEAGSELHEMAARGPVSNVRLIPVVRRGISAAPAILEYASEQDIDLVVIASHGRRGVRRLLLGSVAEEVVRSAVCPVLMVKGREEVGIPTIENIVAPVDFSSHSRTAVAHAAELASSFGARLHLVHVVEHAVYPDFYLPVSVPVYDLGEVRVRAREQLLDLASTCGGGPELEVEVRIGRTAPEIVEFAEAVNADLIVIASHGLHGLERVLLGSVAERVGRHASCSVLTLKAFGKRLLEGADSPEAVEGDRPAVEGDRPAEAARGAAT